MKLIENMKVGRRLALGFGVLLSLVVVLTFEAIDGFVDTIDNRKVMLEMQQRAEMTGEWASLTTLNIARVMAMAKSGNDPQVDAYFTPMMKATSARISEVQGKLTEQIDSEQGKALLAEIAVRRKEYIDFRKQYMAMLDAGDILAAEMLDAKVLPAIDAYQNSQRQLLEYERGLVEKAVANANKATQNLMIEIGIVAGVAIVLGIAVALGITRSVTSPIREALSAADEVANGDLTRALVSHRKDEVGDLLRSLERMRQSLLNTVSQVRRASDSIGLASSEIATGNQDLSGRTEEAASSLEQTAASMEELTSTVSQSAEAARQANQLAASAAETAQRGGQVVSQVVATMNEINSSSQKINDIIGVIDGIAFQTNILALNAAVEAARAGEQGRGFAVVAGEVRTLAQRSAEAAKEIKGLIGASVEKVEDGSRLVGEAGSTMDEIVSSVQRVTDIIGEITAAAGEQSDGINQVNVAVGQLDQMTQQNAALVEQSAAAAESLKDQAHRLSGVINAFRIDGHGDQHSVVDVEAREKPAAARKPAATISKHVSAAPKSLAASAPAAVKSLPPAKAAAPKKPAAPSAATQASSGGGDEGDWESF